MNQRVSTNLVFEISNCKLFNLKVYIITIIVVVAAAAKQLANKALEVAILLDYYLNYYCLLELYSPSNFIYLLINFMVSFSTRLTLNYLCFMIFYGEFAYLMRLNPLEQH